MCAAPTRYFHGAAVRRAAAACDYLAHLGRATSPPASPVAACAHAASQYACASPAESASAAAAAASAPPGATRAAVAIRAAALLSACRFAAHACATTVGGVLVLQLLHGPAFALNWSGWIPCHLGIICLTVTAMPIARLGVCAQVVGMDSASPWHHFSDRYRHANCTPRRSRSTGRDGFRVTLTSIF